MINAKHVIIASLTVTILFISSVGISVPFPWFQATQMTSRNDVYTACGPPDNTTLRGVKGEEWERKGLFWTWTMLIGFNSDNESVTNSSIWVDIGPRHYDIRLNIMVNGRVFINVFSWTIWQSYPLP